MGPLGWSGRLPAWAAGALLGTMIGLPVLAWALWPLIVAPRVDPAAFAPPSPTYTLRTPTPSPSPSPSPSRTPRATVLEMQSQAQAQAEWDRQQADHQDRQDAAEATRSVSPDRCCTRPPATPTPTPTPTPARTPSPTPAPPLYDATPVHVDAYCGRAKLGAVAVAIDGTPVTCTDIGAPLGKWLPTPPPETPHK